MAFDSSITRCSNGRLKMVCFGRVCRSIWNHPFIVAILIFLICLHQYFPSLFHLLLSASPILVCTVVLLGALLVHGQPNNHKVEDGGEMSNKIASPRSGVTEHTCCSNRESVSPKHRFAEVRKDIVEKGLKTSGLVDVGTKVIHDCIEGIDEESCNTNLNQPSGSKTHEGFYLGDIGDRDAQMAKTRGTNQAENCDNRVLQVPNDVRMQQNHFDFSLNQHKHEEDSVDHDSIDYESDTGDRSSLDALISHVILTPQETLPLLDSEEPQLNNHLHDVSPKSELQSLDSNQSSCDSDDETDYRDKEAEDENDGDEDENEIPDDKNCTEKSTILWTEDDKKVLLELRSSEMEKNEHLERLVAKFGDKKKKEQGEEEEEEEAIVASEDDDDDEEEENLKIGKGDSQQVTMWTEEDEKNFRDVGNSELERNQRLENLLAKRRAQRNFSMISERNLIDLERSAIPIQIAPISTARVNPFDVIHNTNLNPNVPPIPGSAPSVPRKNPFDSPSTSPRGTHNVNGVNLKEQSMEVNLNNPLCETNSSTLQYGSMSNLLKQNLLDITRKEVVFRRYESFSLDYNFIEDTSRKNFAEFDQREKEETFSRHQSFSAPRSHFPSTSTLQPPNNFYFKPVFVLEQATEEVDHPSLEKHSSQDSESTSSSESDVESSNASEAHEDGEPNIETEVVSKHDRDRESIVTPDHDSIRSENKSETSSKVTNSPKNDPDEHFTTRLDEKAHSINQTTETSINDSHETTSSTSMSSEEDGGSPNTCKDEGEKVKESVFSPKGSQEGIEGSHTIPEEDNNSHAEPVYDTSPSGVEKIGPFSLAATEI